jgi:hypothetical protein
MCLAKNKNTTNQKDEGEGERRAKGKEICKKGDIARGKLLPCE